MKETEADRCTRARCTASGGTRSRDAISRHLRVVLLVLVAGSAMQRAPAQVLRKQLLDSRVTQQSIGGTICRPGYTDAMSPPLDELMARKDQLLAARGIPADDGASYALDRRVPIVLGGSPNAAANLDLLPWAGHGGERRKEILTARLKRCVCTGRISLSDAQSAIAGNWTSQYARLSQMHCGGNPTDADGHVDDGP